MSKKASNFKDLTGQKFGRLTVFEYLGARKMKSWWKCQCECGNIIETNTNHLHSGHTKSCGCLNKEGNNKTHELSKTPIYKLWRNMKTRCYNKNISQYKDWGGRGIKVCERWLKFENFYEDMFPSYKKGLSLERIDNNKDYCLENCKWIPKNLQVRNRRMNKLNEESADYIRNSNKSVKELMDMFGVKKSLIYYVRSNQLWKQVK